MHNIRLKRSFAFGLYVYLQQAELSTDRVLGHPWHMLHQFYQSDERIMPHFVVAAYTQHISNSSLDFDFHQTINEDMIFVKHSTKVFVVLYRILINIWKSLQNSWNWHFMKVISLNENQFLFILQTLMKLDQLLNTKQNPNNLEINSLRENLCLSGMILKMHMPLCSECDQAQKVRHLNQNEYLTFLPFSEIVGKSQKEWIDLA